MNSKLQQKNFNTINEIVSNSFVPSGCQTNKVNNAYNLFKPANYLNDSRNGSSIEVGLSNGRPESRSSSI